MNADDYRQTEKALLGKSHPPEKVNELLEDRYSVSGGQKPYLILVPTDGLNVEEEKEPVVNVNQTALSAAFGLISQDGKSKPRKSRLQSAKASLTQYIKDSQAAQDRAQKQVRRGQANTVITDEFLLQNKVPVYGQYLALHGLWRNYISTLLFGSTNATSSTALSKQHRLTLAGKVASADFHGALLEVTSAKNPSMVGLTGIVVWEARSHFVLVVAAKPSSSSIREKIGGIRLVEKRGSMFSFTAGEGELSENFDIVGSRFLYRNADRSGRKFKSKAVDDL